ncbi:Vta1 like-domain-containing protein [Tuber brumale]|nr:Vta1 like-domain-containing protein [Tuber brumale]
MAGELGPVREPPPELKSIKQFVRRGNQLRSADPVIAYYCYFWSVKQVLANHLHQASTACTTWTADLMDELERRKEELKDKDIIGDDIAAQAYVENFALKIFENGAGVVAAGKATSTTADTLLAAVCFLELVRIFAEPDAEIQQKIRFAKFHAARILKAINLGQDPNPSTPEPMGAPEAHTSLPPPPTVEDEVPSLLPPPTSAPVISLLAPQEPGKAPSPRPGEQGPELFHDSGSPSILTPPPPARPMFQAPPPALPQIHMSDTCSDYFPQVPIVHEPSAPSLSPSTMSAANTGFPEMHTQHSLNIHYPPPAPDTVPSAAPQGYNYNINQPASYYSQPSVPAQQLSIPTPPRPVMKKHEPTEEDILRAQKHARWAISALDYEDIETAIKEFRLGLERLGAL